MSAQPCRNCGELRKCDQVAAPDGWHQPPCYHCGDPGYTEPYDIDPSHTPAPPQNIGLGTGLVYCRACGFLLWSDSGPSKGHRAYEPCTPVRVGPRG